MLVVLDFFRGSLPVKEEKVGFDAGVGIKDSVGEADDRVEVALLEKPFFQPGLHTFPEERPIGKDESCPSGGLQQVNQKKEKEVRRLFCPVGGREVRFNAILFDPAEGWIGDYDIHPVPRAVGLQGTGEGVVMVDLRRYLDPVEEHIGHAEKVGHRLLLDAMNRFLKGFPVFHRLYIPVPDMLNGAGEKAPCPAGRIQDGFPQLWIDLVHDKLRYRSGRVVLPCVSGALKVLKDLLIEIAKHVAVLTAGEVHLRQLVDHLAHQVTGFHIVVGIFKDGADDGGAGIAIHPYGEVFQGAEEIIVDEVEKLVPGHSFRVRCPVPPAEAVGDRRGVIVLQDFQLLFLIVKDLEEEHPSELADPLGVSIHAHVFAHDVLNGLDGGADAHGRSFPLLTPRRRGRLPAPAGPAGILPFRQRRKRFPSAFQTG